jgi:threonine/homoserine/homoserine lactone efflux protein
MPGASTIALFALASLALAVVPGPAVTYIVTQSVDKGRQAGVASAAGVASGGLVHVAAATVGLSALIASSATAFTTVKLVGAAYLIAVGIRRILSKDETLTEPQPAPLQRVWAQGVVVNIFNPKTALFFLAFLPQFVDRTSTIWTQVAFLGCLFSLIAFCSDLMYALLADALAARLRRGGRAAAVQRWVSGGIFVALGLTAAAAHRS